MYNADVRDKYTTEVAMAIEVKRSGKNDYDMYVNGCYVGSRATYAQAYADAAKAERETLMDSADDSDGWRDDDLADALREVLIKALAASCEAEERGDEAAISAYDQLAKACERARVLPVIKWRHAASDVIEVLSRDGSTVYTVRKGACTCPARRICYHRAVRAAVLFGKL